MLGNTYVGDSKDGTGPSSAELGASQGREIFIATAIKIFLTKSHILRKEKQSLQEIAFIFAEKKL